MSDPVASYEELFSVLVSIGTEQFHIDEDVARELTEDVFYASLRSRGEIEAVTWLTAAMSAASRTYQRR
jgi:hypothetical protein